MILAPITVLCAVVFVVWNERQPICELAALDQVRDSYREVGCSRGDLAQDGLVAFSCDLSQEGLQPLSPAGLFKDSLSFVGTGLKWKVEMFQCVEHKNEEPIRSFGGGAGVGRTETYSYSLDWVEHHVNSLHFHNQPGTIINSRPHSCGSSHNPPWPGQLPKSGTSYAPEVQVGPFTLGPTFLAEIPLTWNVDANSTPDGWFTLERGSYATNRWVVGPEKIGETRITFYGNDWSNPKLSVLGQNSDGLITTWWPGGMFGCTRAGAWSVKPGRLDPEQLIDSLRYDTNFVTWKFRIGGFMALWLGFALCLRPLEVLPGCSPCLGSLLGDKVSKSSVCWSSVPAFLCFMLVAGVSWAFARPMVGGCLLLAVLAISTLLVCSGKQRELESRLFVEEGYGATGASSSSA